MEFYLVTYDIPGDKRRAKIASLLEDYGHRVQYSVFEIWLERPALSALTEQVAAIIEPKEDSVRFYRLCAVCQRAVAVLGTGEIPQAPDVLII